MTGFRVESWGGRSGRFRPLLEEAQDDAPYPFARPFPPQRHPLCTALGATLLLGNQCPENSPIAQVGVCKRDITPISPGLADAYEAAFGGPAVVNHTDPVWLAGFGNGRAATGYNDRLWARGIVVNGRGGRVAIVSIDLIGYFNAEVQNIRALVDPASKIDYLVVSSTHQHEGPDTLGIWGPDPVTSGQDPAYIDFVNAAVADCVDEAAANLAPARLKFVTTDSSGLSLGLDVEDDGLGVADSRVLEGDELLAPATDGRITDPRLSIMQATRLGPPKEVFATLVNFARWYLGPVNHLTALDFLGVTDASVAEGVPQAYLGLSMLLLLAAFLLRRRQLTAGIS